MEEIRIRLEQIEEELVSLELEDWGDGTKAILRYLLNVEKNSILKEYHGKI